MCLIFSNAHLSLDLKTWFVLTLPMLNLFYSCKRAAGKHTECAEVLTDVDTVKNTLFHCAIPKGQISQVITCRLKSITLKTGPLWPEIMIHRPYYHKMIQHHWLVYNMDRDGTGNKQEEEATLMFPLWKSDLCLKIVRTHQACNVKIFNHTALMSLWNSSWNLQTAKTKVKV